MFGPNKSFRREICGRGGFRLHLGTSFLGRRRILDPCPAAFGYRLRYRPNDAVRTRRPLRRAKVHRCQRDHVAAEDRSSGIEILSPFESESFDRLTAT